MIIKGWWREYFIGVHFVRNEEAIVNVIGFGWKIEIKGEMIKNCGRFVIEWV